MRRIVTHPEITASLRGGRPVVALESAVVTSGMPRAAVEKLDVDVKGWRSDRPVNLEVALMMDRAVRQTGATPAMIAVIDGALRVGLDANDIERLALDERAGRASISNLAACCAAGETAGTTVSATLQACDIAGIRVFATGGIGGVHRPRQGAAGALDVSADLLQLSRTPALVVCAGAKSILDVPATLEALEALGVPVLGYRTDRFPQFYSAGTDDLPVPRRVDSTKVAAGMCRLHWQDLRVRGGILLANATESHYTLEPAEVDRLVSAAEREAAALSISGSARTPFLLDVLARLSGGRTLRANIALLESNARLAAAVAKELSG